MSTPTSEANGNATVFACAGCGQQSTSRVGKQVDGLWYCFTCAPTRTAVTTEGARTSKELAQKLQDCLEAARGFGNSTFAPVPIPTIERLIEMLTPSIETDDVRSVLEEIVARVNERPRGVTKNHPLIARAREVLGPPTTPKASEGQS